jgi:transporter family-2 protein
MDRWLAVMLTAVFGGLVAAQAPINSSIGRIVGSVQAATISFTVGMITLVLLSTLAFGGFSVNEDAPAVPWYYWIAGGLLGAAYVTTVLITVRTIGASGVTVATIAAQLVVASLLDQFGAFGLIRQPLTFARIMGIVLLGVGVYLVVRD